MAKRKAEAKKSKKRRARFASPFSTTPIAQKLIAHLRSFGPPDESASVEALVELSDGLARLDTPTGVEEEIDPVGLHYLDCVKLMTFVGNSLGSHSALAKLLDRIEAADEYYSPEGPPLSPVTHSLFMQWSLLDAQQGIGRETMGSVVEAVQRALNPESEVLDVMTVLNRSRLGVYVQERSRKKGGLTLREMITGKVGEYACESGYLGKPGNVLLVRALPPPNAGTDHGAILMTPYVLEGGVEAEWNAFFDRVLPSLGGSDRVRGYEQLMKSGTGPSGDRYWLDYVDSAYLEDLGDSIVLAGVPDLERSDDDDDEIDDDVNELGAHERALLATMTGEMLQPVRLYWEVSRPVAVQQVLGGLGCVVPDPGIPGIWHWLHQDETLALEFPKRYDEISPEVHPINLGMFRLEGRTLALRVRSQHRALLAARFFGPRFGAHATLARARVLNRLLDGREHRALGLEGIDALLDEGVVVIDPSQGEERHERDIPLVEDFPLAPEEETPDFQHLAVTLMFRLLRAREHWNGNTDVTLRDVIQRLVAERMAHVTQKTTRGRSARRG